MSTLVLPDWAVVSDERREHIARVVALVESWAHEMGVERSEAERWRRAALLHDSLRDADEATLARHVARGAWPVKLWHGPAAAAAAASRGEADVGVINAVRYHSVGFSGWDRAGRMLYLADFLEPDRDRVIREAAELRGRVVSDPDGVLLEVARLRLGWMVRTGKPIGRETWLFWNSLAGARPQ